MDIMERERLKLNLVTIEAMDTMEVMDTMDIMERERLKLPMVMLLQLLEHPLLSVAMVPLQLLELMLLMVMLLVDLMLLTLLVLFILQREMLKLHLVTTDAMEVMDIMGTTEREMLELLVTQHMLPH